MTDSDTCYNLCTHVSYTDLRSSLLICGRIQAQSTSGKRWTKTTHPTVGHAWAPMNQSQCPTRLTICGTITFTRSCAEGKHMSGSANYACNEPTCVPAAVLYRVGVLTDAQMAACEVCALLGWHDCAMAMTEFDHSMAPQFGHQPPTNGWFPVVLHCTTRARSRPS